MNDTVKKNENILQSIKLTEVRNYRSKVKEYKVLPDHLDSYMPTLVSKVDQGKELSIEIGDFRAILKRLLQTSLPANVSRLTNTLEELKDKARVVATIPTDFKSLLGGACVGDAEAWIHKDKTTITRIEINGTEKDTFITTYQYGLCGIALTREGELIFSDSNSKTVNVVRHGESETLITTPEGWSPRRLCCTRSGDILVHVYFLLGRSKIIRYQGKKIKQEIYNDD